MNTKELILPDDWEVKEVVGNKIIIKKKEKELPKTWRECFKPDDDDIEYLDLQSGENAVPSNLKKPMLALCQLLVCRNAWWKRLEWKPDDSTGAKFVIYTRNNEIAVGWDCVTKYILEFPSEEIRDKFADTFRDLIEEAKELL